MESGNAIPGGHEGKESNLHVGKHFEVMGQDEGGSVAMALRVAVDGGFATRAIERRRSWLMLMKMLLW